MGQKLHRYIACVKHRARGVARIWAIKIVCAVSTVTESQGCVDRQEKKKQIKENLQSPLHPVEEVAQKQGYFTDNLLEYRCIWYGCFANSCYATQRFTFFLSYSQNSVCT